MPGGGFCTFGGTAESGRQRSRAGLAANRRAGGSGARAAPQCAGGPKLFAGRPAEKAGVRGRLAAPRRAAAFLLRPVGFFRCNCAFSVV